MSVLVGRRAHEAIDRLERQGDPTHGFCVSAEPGAVIEIVHEAAAGLGQARDTQQHLVADERQVERALEFLVVEVAETARDIAAEFIGGFLGFVENRAAGCVAAKQRALRPFQDLHALQIEESGCRGRGYLQVIDVREHAG